MIINKEEAKQLIRDTLETVASLREDLIALEMEAYDAYVAVEPYGGRDELTQTQEELRRWFYFLQMRAREAKDALDDLEDMAH